MIYCVDLDGTLITYDMSVISYLRTIKKNKITFFKSIYWYIKGGRALVKSKIAPLYDFDVNKLPFNEELIAILEELATDSNNQLYLVSGSAQLIVEKIAENFKFFTKDKAFGTSININLVANNKAEFIKQQFPNQEVCYVGNSKADLKVWPHVKHGIVISSDPNLIKQAQTLTKVLKVLPKASAKEKI